MRSIHRQKNFRNLSLFLLQTKHITMITPNPLLSENVKDFMDYALEVIKSMDGAPEHTAADRLVVNENIAKLKEYLEAVSTSYNETIPNNVNSPTGDIQGNFSGTGHS